MIYLCRVKYHLSKYDNEGFRRDDTKIDAIRLVQADDEKEALTKIADKLNISLWYGMDFIGRKGALQIHDVEISEMIL